MSKFKWPSALCALVLFFISSVLLAQTNLNDLAKERDALIKSNNRSDAAKVCYQIGSQYWKNKDFKNSELAFEQGIDLSQANNNKSLTLQGKFTYALVLMDFNKHSDAIKQLKDSEDLATTIGDRDTKARVLINEGICYFKTSKEKRAIKYVEDALALTLQLKKDDLTKECYSLLAQYYSKIGDNAKSIEYQNNYELIEQQSEREAQLSEIERQMSSVEKRMSSVQSELQKKDEAISEKDKALEQVSDSLEEVTELNKERALQIDLLNAEKNFKDMELQAQKAELKNNELIRNFLIIGVLMAIAMVGIVLYDYRKNIKKNKKIEEQHKNITSSINYAQRIQEAMLPPSEQLKSLLTDSFVLFLPRDKVSGDFYWAKILETKNYDQFGLAAVDCTGHGVPGAFMSMIAMNALNSIVGKGITSASEILSNLHHEIYTSLKQNKSGNKDGMDMALCTIDLRNKVLTYAGAKNPLLYIKDGEIHQIRGDKHPIGGGKDAQVLFKEHQVKIEDGMTFYMYSDGYVDQFGGPDNMKFMSKKFKELLLRIAHLPMEEQCKRLEGEFEKWKGSQKQIDDVLVLGFKI